MSRSSRNLGVRVLPNEEPPKRTSLRSLRIPPERPPKPNEFQFVEEPLYQTTLPTSLPPTVPPKPKGILKTVSQKPSNLRSFNNGIQTRDNDNKRNSDNSSFIVSKFKSKKNIPDSADDEGHFDLTIEEPSDITLTEQNTEHSLLSSGSKSNGKSSQKNKNIKIIPPVSKKSKKSVRIKDTTSKNRRENITNLPPDKYSRALYAARLESMSGIMHLIVIVCSVITLISMAILTNDWELRLRRCPLYVKTSINFGVYWGNEKLAPCHYTAYMPAVTLIMSFSMILFHGGLLLSWRRGYEAYRILLSKTYTKILFFINLLEMVISISITGVLIDGVRQTCLGFQVNPWSVERPENCKEGYQDRDEVYGISHTYVKLMTSMVASTISSFVLIIITIFYFVRIVPCCKGMKQ